MLAVAAAVAAAAAAAVAVRLSAGDSHNRDVDKCGFFLDRSRNRTSMILVYTSRVIAATRTVVQPGSRLFFSGSSRLCRRYIFPVLLELLGLVFVEFASERG